MNTRTSIHESGGMRQRGFGLIELMIAMALGLFLVSGIGYVFVGTKATYNTLEGLSRIQENARYAFEYMGKDIRLAGFTGGSSSSCTDIVASTWAADLAALCTDPAYPSHPEGPLRGYDDNDTSSFVTTTLDPVAGDVLTVVHADVDNEYSISSAVTGTFTIDFGDACPSTLPKDDEIFVAADYTHSAIFEIDTAGACSSGSMDVTYTGVPGAFGGALAARKLYPLRGAAYYIDNNAGGEPSLYRLELGAGATAATEVIQGVENMQIVYGEDAATGDGVAAVTDYRATASAVTNWNNVLSVRITLTMVTESDINLAPSDDGQLTKDFTQTIAVRNRL